MGNGASDTRDAAEVDLLERRDLPPQPVNSAALISPRRVSGTGGYPLPPNSARGFPSGSRGGDGDVRGALEKRAGSSVAADANTRGVEMLRQGQHTEAVKHFQTALSHEPGSVQILNNIGLAYAKMQDFGSAYEWYERAYKEDVRDVETLFSLAWVERKRQHYLHAKELFQRVLDMQPDHQKALYLLGDILKTAQDYDGALWHFERLVRLDPQSVEGRVSLAQCYEQGKQYPRAAQLYSNVLQLAPGRTDVVFYLGRVLYLAKQYKQSVTHFDRVPDTDSKGFESRTHAAKACRELEDHERAVSNAERASRLKPHPEVLHFLGEEYLRLGDAKKAVLSFEGALDLDANHAPTLLELGHLMYRQSRWHEAETHFSRLCDLSSSNVAALRSLALVKFKQNKFDACRQRCNDTLKLDPLNSDALWLLAEMHRQEGAPGDDCWFLGIRSPPEVSVADICQTIAKGYLTRKQVHESVAWLQKVQHYLPRDLRVQDALSMLSRHGAAVNPQDVLDVLDSRRPASSSTLSQQRDFQDYLRTPRRLSTADDRRPDDAPTPRRVDEDLEALLRRAERGPQGEGSAEWREVLRAAKATLARHSDDALALRCAARALLATGAPEKEIREYARRAATCADEPGGTSLGFDLHCYLASCLEREKDYAAAERHYTQALSSKPGEEKALLGLASVCLQRRDTTKAKPLLEQVAAANPSSAEALTKLAEIGLEAREFDEAYRLAGKASRLASGDGGAWLCLGQACAKTGRTEEAFQALERGLALEPGNATAMSTLAGLYVKAGRDQEAIPWLKRVVEQNPDDYDASLSLAQLHAARGVGGASQALLYFRSALQCKPSARDVRDIHSQMAAVQISAGAWRDAQVTLESGLSAAPDSSELWRQLLTVCTHLQDAKGQQHCHRRLAQLSGSAPTDRVAFGELLLADGQLREAREQFELAIKVDPSNAVALVKLANAWRLDTRAEDSLDEAKSCYERALQLSPTNFEALEGAGYCHRKMNNLDQAAHFYQQCLKVRFNAEGALYYLGDILYRQHRHAECQHYLARLVDLDCSVDYKTGALYLLAKSHVALDEYEDAAKKAQHGLSLKPSHPHFLFILALVRNRVADYDSSIVNLRQALQHCDHSDGDQLRVDVHDLLAQAYERKGDYSEAMTEIERALQLDPSHVSSLITRGLVHTQLKQLDQAETALRRALAVDPNHALALVRLGYCKLLSSDYLEATQYLQKALLQRALLQQCGTVALPRSVKGSARIYMALALMGQQDVTGALLQLSEGRKSHKNFCTACVSGKPQIVKGDCEGLVQQLRRIPDLHINLAQAWQLVHLMAKELESDLRDTSTSRGGTSTATTASSSTAVAAGASLPVAGSDAGSGARAVPSSAQTLGASPRHVAAARDLVTSAGGLARGAAAILSRYPPAAASQPARAVGGSAPPLAAARTPTAAASSSKPASPPPERRRWLAPEPAPAPAPKPSHPSSSSTAPAPAAAGQCAAASAGGPLRLEPHEQVDFTELEQKDCLGTGGFGAVYRGYCRGKEVAIKKLFCEDGGNISPLQLEELEKEVAALRSLSHPRLVRFIAACLQPPNLCIVTEFMAGGSLHHLLHKAKTPLTVSQQGTIALQVSEGVAFLHNRVPPVVHRDLKSLNIVLDRSYNAKICDFGLTQSMEKTHISLKEGGNGGSPRYMAPECYDCKGKITEKVDVWALGCILVEVFGGPLPYDDCNNIQQILAKVLIDKQLPYIPRHLPRGVRPIVEDCFHFDIKQRTTAQDVYSRLRELRLSPTEA